MLVAVGSSSPSPYVMDFYIIIVFWGAVLFIPLKCYSHCFLLFVIYIVPGTTFCWIRVFYSTLVILLKATVVGSNGRIVTVQIHGFVPFRHIVTTIFILVGPFLVWLLWALLSFVNKQSSVNEGFNT